MASLPTFAKTWQFNVNQRILQSPVSARVHEQMILLALKNSLKGFSTNPWIVQYSCNAGVNGAGGANSGAAGTAGDLVDRWTVADTASGANSTNDINKNSGGSRHSWIVLRQTGIATNFELCIDANPTNDGLCTFVVSPSAGFTGGTVTARPTATDEIVLLNAATWMSAAGSGYFTNTDHILHVWQSTDGQCTRWVLLHGGSLGVWSFGIYDKPQNPVSGWTNPSISIQMGSGSTASMIYSNLNGASNVKARGGGATPNFSMPFTGEFAGAHGNNLLAALGAVTAPPNAFDQSFPLFPLGLASTASGNAGRLGNVFDLWWRPIGLNTGDTLPNDQANRKVVCFGDLVFPWKEDTTVPVLA